MEHLKNSFSIDKSCTKPDKLVQSAYEAPSRIILEGKYTLLVPLEQRFYQEIYDINFCEDAAERYYYSYSMPIGDFKSWFENVSNPSNPMITFAILEKSVKQTTQTVPVEESNSDSPARYSPETEALIKSSRVIGHVSLMNIEPIHGRLEIGGVKMGPQAARTRCSTETHFLLLDYAFSTLGYRRVEWKCDSANLASFKAARRLGFEWEGKFRQHIVTRHGQNRDSEWFSMLDYEWLEEAAQAKEAEEALSSEDDMKKKRSRIQSKCLKKSFLAWLNEENFDENGQQICSLTDLRQKLVLEAEGTHLEA